MSMRCAAALVCLLVPLCLAAQLPPERRLDGPATRLSHDFVSITSVRELRDGRVLVTDPRGDLFAVADFAGDEVTAVGRKGRGPGEYQWIPPIFPLGDDSSLMAISDNRRWLVLKGAQIVMTLPPDAPVVSSGRTPLGVDTLGRVLSWNDGPRFLGERVMARGDSVALLLMDRRSGSIDSIGRVRVSGGRVEASLDARGRRTISFRQSSPFEMMEPALLFPDGWIAVVRREPYRVEWRSPGGAWRIGASIPVARVRIDATERRATMRFSAEQYGSKVGDPAMYERWPEYLPAIAPYRTYPVVPTSDGLIAIRRTRSARAPEPRYDIVDRTGRVVQRLVLSPGEAIVAFGRGTVYVVRTDEDGVLYLERRAWRHDGR